MDTGTRKRPRTNNGNSLVPNFSNLTMRNNNTKNNKNVLDVLIEKVAPKLKRDLEIDNRTYQRNPSGINLFKAKAKPLTPQSLIELLRDLGFVNTSRRTVNEIVEKNDIHIVAVLQHILSKIPAKSI